MPVLPLVESSKIFPAASLPERRASATMLAAARSLTDPPGLYHSALPQRCTQGRSRTSASNRNSGVLPMAVSTASPLRPDAASAGENRRDGADSEGAGFIEGSGPCD